MKRSNAKVTGVPNEHSCTCMRLVVPCGTVNDGDSLKTDPPEPRSRALWRGTKQDGGSALRTGSA